eukprot:m.747476 g.747476  ORF g.747476 m.747476 type:complete len:103 (+) comp58963_c0_seq6:2468-2776(+)
MQSCTSNIIRPIHDSKIERAVFVWTKHSTASVRNSLEIQSARSCYERFSLSPRAPAHSLGNLNILKECRYNSRLGVGFLLVQARKFSFKCLRKISIFSLSST